jgi:hypothetical protein
VRWPAWGYDYQLHSVTNPAGDWSPMTNRTTVVGFENVISSPTTAAQQFFRLLH